MTPPLRFALPLALALLAWPGLVAAGTLWVPDFCLAQPFSGSTALVSDFRATGMGCAFPFEDALRGTIRTQVSQWLLGVTVDLGLVASLVATAGARSKTGERLEIRGVVPNATSTQRFFVKASQRRVVLGFSLTW